MQKGSFFLRLTLILFEMLDSVRLDLRGESEGLGLALLGVLARFIRSACLDMYFPYL